MREKRYGVSEMTFLSNSLDPKWFMFSILRLKRLQLYSRPTLLLLYNNIHFT